MSNHTVTVAHISELPEGGQLKVDLEDRELLLCRFEEQVYAIDYYCSHDQLGLEGG